MAQLLEEERQISQAAAQRCGFWGGSRGAQSALASSSLRAGRGAASGRGGVLNLLSLPLRTTAPPPQAAAAAVAATPIPTQLNTIPHTREIRRYFYSEATEAVRKALEAGLKRLSIRCGVALDPAAEGGRRCLVLTTSS